MGLIDALLAYVQNCVAASRCDDKVRECPQSGMSTGDKPAPPLLSWAPVGSLSLCSGWNSPRSQVPRILEAGPSKATCPGDNDGPLGTVVCSWPWVSCPCGWANTVMLGAEDQPQKEGPVGTWGLVALNPQSPGPLLKAPTHKSAILLGARHLMGTFRAHPSQGPAAATSALSTAGVGVGGREPEALNSEAGPSAHTGRHEGTGREARCPGPWGQQQDGWLGGRSREPGARSWGDSSSGSGACAPGPQSVENCMCVLHNLSYRLDAEVPTRYRQLEYNSRNMYTEKSSTGCFSNKSDKMMVSRASPRPRPRPGHPSPLPTAACWPPREDRGVPADRGLCVGTEGAQTAPGHKLQTPWAS